MSKLGINKLKIFAKHLQVYPTNGQPAKQSYIDNTKFRVPTMVTPKEHSHQNSYTSLLQTMATKSFLSLIIIYHACME